jgi:hypothetical protein
LLLKGLFGISSTEKEGWALLGREGGRCICGIPSWATPCEDEEWGIARTGSGYIGDGTSSELWGDRSAELATYTFDEAGISPRRYRSSSRETR